MSDTNPCPGCGGSLKSGRALVLVECVCGWRGSRPATPADAGDLVGELVEALEYEHRPFGRKCPIRGVEPSGRDCRACALISRGWKVSASPRCPTCGFVMCEGFDYEPLNDLATLATPNGTFACLSGRCEETGLVVDCTVCGKRKAPRGRSVPDAMANGLCGWECPGYDQEPRVNDLWPNEKRWQFGYPCVPPQPPQEGEGSNRSSSDKP